MLVLEFCSLKISLIEENSGREALKERISLDFGLSENRPVFFSLFAQAIQCLLKKPALLSRVVNYINNNFSYPLGVCVASLVSTYGPNF